MVLFEKNKLCALRKLKYHIVHTKKVKCERTYSAKVSWTKERALWDAFEKHGEPNLQFPTQRA